MLTPTYRFKIPFKPRSQQLELYSNLKRFNVIVCHRRFGKTVFAVNEIISKALTNKIPRARYAYIAPLKNQAKALAWDYIKLYAGDLPDVSFNETELRCDLPNGAKIFVLGADNPDALRGIYLDGVVMDEVAQMPMSIWGQVVRPTLADRKGWAIFIGTPKGPNFFYELFQRANKDPDWYSKVYKSSETGLPSPEEIEAMRRELSDEEFQQELECSFTAAVTGTYYGKIIETLIKEHQVRPLPADPNIPVITAWDLGINDKTAIWFVQHIAGEIRVIDYLEDSGEALPYYVNKLKEKPYVYDCHILPHDAKQRSLATGKTSMEQLQSLGLKCKIANKLPIRDGISAVRNMLPKCYFEEEKCAKGLIALQNYRSAFNDILGTFSNTPLHDANSHAADAFRYLATTLKNQRSYSEVFYPGEKFSIIDTSDYDPFK